MDLYAWPVANKYYKHTQWQHARSVGLPFSPNRHVVYRNVKVHTQNAGLSLGSTSLSKQKPKDSPLKTLVQFSMSPKNFSVCAPA